MKELEIVLEGLTKEARIITGIGNIKVSVSKYANAPDIDYFVMGDKPLGRPFDSIYGYGSTLPEAIVDFNAKYSEAKESAEKDAEETLRRIKESK